MKIPRFLQPNSYSTSNQQNKQILLSTPLPIEGHSKAIFYRLVYRSILIDDGDHHHHQQVTAIVLSLP